VLLDAIYRMSNLGQCRRMPSGEFVQRVQSPNRLFRVAQGINGVYEFLFITAHVRRVCIQN
jgi:hypothetical protein